MNFGCGATFTQSENHPKVCCYHPGVWQFGSYNVKIIISIIINFFLNKTFIN